MKPMLGMSLEINPCIDGIGEYISGKQWMQALLHFKTLQKALTELNKNLGEVFTETKIKFWWIWTLKTGQQTGKAEPAIVTRVQINIFDRRFDKRRVLEFSWFTESPNEIRAMQNSNPPAAIQENVLTPDSVTEVNAALGQTLRKILTEAA